MTVAGVTAKDEQKLSAVPPGGLTEHVEMTVQPIPLPISEKRDLKVAPTSVELFQHDEEPIGNRKPLLLVHGLRGEFREGFRWDRVAEELTKDPQFRQTFKIYYARYNTYTLLPAMKPHFKRVIRELYHSTQKRPITVVALSMGGNLIQEAMEDTDVANSIEKVLTMGTPFHGSPLFCFDWLRYSIIRSHSVPWVRADLCLSYKMYFKRHPNLIEDLRWDDSDKGIPQVGPFSTWYPFHVTGDLSIDRWNNPRILDINKHIQVDKSKFICYGGYLLTPYVTPHRSSHFWKAVRWPWWFATCTVPYHMGFEHPVLRALNYEMGRMVVAGPNEKGVILHSSRYGLNDGITPLVSALFLPTDVLAQMPVNREPDISTIRQHVDVKRARVFRQIDHLTFIDGYRPERLPDEIRDELAPDQKERNIFDWILTDLLDRDTAVAGQPAATPPTKEASAIQKSGSPVPE